LYFTRNEGDLVYLFSRSSGSLLSVSLFGVSLFGVSLLGVSLLGGCLLLVGLSDHRNRVTTDLFVRKGGTFIASRVTNTNSGRLSTVVGVNRSGGGLLLGLSLLLGDRLGNGDASLGLLGVSLLGVSLLGDSFLGVSLLGVSLLGGDRLGGVSLLGLFGGRLGLDGLGLAGLYLAIVLDVNVT
jgi:hypothetical protein